MSTHAISAAVSRCTLVAMLGHSMLRSWGLVCQVVLVNVVVLVHGYISAACRALDRTTRELYFFELLPGPENNTMAPTPLTLAVCLFPDVASLDYQGPIEQLGFISPKFISRGMLPQEPPVTVEVTYLAPTTSPVDPGAGPQLLPNKAYDDVKEGEQFDIILVPGGESHICLPWLFNNVDHS